jgi:hypothetical protein
MHDAEAAIQIIVPRVRELASALAIRARFVAPRIVDLWTFAPVRAVPERPLEDGRDTLTAHSFADALSNFAAVDAHARYMRTAALVEALRAEAAVRAAVTLSRSLKAPSILTALRTSDMLLDDAAPPASAITLAMNWSGCSWCEPHSPGLASARDLRRSRIAATSSSRRPASTGTRRWRAHARASGSRAAA